MSTALLAESNEFNFAFPRRNFDLNDKMGTALGGPETATGGFEGDCDGIIAFGSSCLSE